MGALYNLARMTTATTGTGTITLGSAVSGYLTFAQAGVPDGRVVSYGIKDGSNSESGIGTYTTSGTTLTRTVTNSTNSNAAISLSGSAEVFISPLASDFREKLFADRTYYARTDGSDSNAGLSNSSGGAFLTPQKLADTIGMLDASIYNVTGQLGNGTYTSGFTFRAPLGSGYVNIKGDTTTPSNVILSPTGNSCVTVSGAAQTSTLWLEGVKLQTTTSGYGIAAAGSFPANIWFDNIDFGTVAAGHSHIFASTARLLATGNYTISGGAAYHVLAGELSLINITGRTVTLTGTPAFSSSFIDVSGGSLALAQSMTFSGSATGKRFNVTNNAVINTGGGGANYFPGSSAGTGTNSGTSPYGLYI